MSVLDSRIRVLALAILSGVEKASFRYLKEKLQTTDGNLSVHMQKLCDAGYARMEKVFEGKKPKTYFYITENGRKALLEYIEELNRSMSSPENIGKNEDKA